MTFTVLQGDARHLPLADRSVHCCVTSPPYWCLRDYGVPGQLGLEPTPDAYVANMVAVFREVWRVLRPDGTLWLNLGDSFASSGIPGKRASGDHPRDCDCDYCQMKYAKRIVPMGLKPKDLVGIPWRVAFALQADGWYLRSDVIWAKGLSFCESYAGSCMPESVSDRPTSAHEHVFLLAKAPRYYYDNEAVKETAVRLDNFHGAYVSASGRTMERNGRQEGSLATGMRNLRNVWAINPAGFAEAHFATFPPALVEPCIKAGTSERGCCPACGAPWQRVVERGLTAHDGDTESLYEKGSTANRLARLRQAARARGEEYSNGTRTLGWQPTCGCPEHEPVPCVVLDPFSGAGTSGLVASRLGRHYVGVELSKQYADMSYRRIRDDAPLLHHLEHTPVSCDRTDKDQSDCPVSLPLWQMQNP